MTKIHHRARPAIPMFISEAPIERSLGAPAAPLSPSLGTSLTTALQSPQAPLTSPLVNAIFRPKEEVSELFGVLTGFKELMAAQGNARPVAAPAAFLETTLAKLDHTPISAHDLVFTTGCTDHELDLMRDAFTKVEPPSLDRARQAMSPEQQVTFERVCVDLRRPYLEQVTRAALQVQTRAIRLGTRSADPLRDALEQLPPVSLPAPGFSALDGLRSVDIEALTQVVMMECAKDSEHDLRTLFTEMKKTNAQRAHIRRFVTEQKRRKAAAQEDLQREYDRRCSLAKGKEERINPELTSFELYARSQLLVQYGVVKFDEQGMPVAPELSYEVSPNIALYRDKAEAEFGRDGSAIAQTTVDLAKQLGIKSQVASDLVRYWETHLAELKAVEGQTGRFPSIEAWLLAPKTAGGVGFAFPPPEDAFQDTLAEEYLTQRDPEHLYSVLKTDYGVTPAGAKLLVDQWTAQSEAFRNAYDGKMTAWLSEAPPFGPGYVPSAQGHSDEDVQKAIAVFVTERSFGDLGTNFGLDRAELTALAAYHSKDPRGLTFAAFLTDVVGCKKDCDNSAGARAKMNDLAQAINHPEADIERADYTQTKAYADWKTAHDREVLWNDTVHADPLREKKAALGAGRSRDDSDKLLERIGLLTDTLATEANLYPQKRNDRAAEINVYGEGIIYDDTRPGKVDCDEKIRELIQTSLVVADLKAQGFAGGNESQSELYRFWRNKQDGAQQAAIDYVNSLSGPSKAIAANYIKMQLALAAQDERAMVVRGKDSYSQNGYENQFTAGMFYAPPALQCAWYKMMLPDGSFHPTFLAKDRHDEIASELTEYRNSWDPQTPTFELIGDMTVRPPEAGLPPPVTLSEKLIAELHPKTEAAKAAFDAMDSNSLAYQQAATAGPKNQTGSTATALPVDAAFVAKVHALATPLDHSLKQPDHIEVEGAEMSLGRLEADIEAWQAKYDTLGDCSEEQGIKLQMYQQRRTKFFEALSNLMKKFSDVSSAIVGNLK